MKKKMKTKKAALNRFKITGSGKILRKCAGKRHLLLNKSSKKKRLKRNEQELSDSDLNKLKRMIPGL